MKYKRLIDVLFGLQFTVDTHVSHPEETTLHHVVQSFVRAKKESDDKELWVAALFHDIGKQIETHGHEQLGVDILESFGYKNEKVLWLISRHMRIRWLFNGRLVKRGKIQDMLSNKWLPELVHLRRLDALGREIRFKINLDYEEINQLLEETSGQTTKVVL